MSTEGSSLSIEVGNYQFLSDLTYMEDATLAAEESGITLKAPWLIATLASMMMVTLLG